MTNEPNASMDGHFLERVIAIFAVVWAASALALAWLFLLAPSGMGRAAYVSLLLGTAAALAASTVALGGIRAAPVAVVLIALSAYFAFRRR